MILRTGKVEFPSMYSAVSIQESAYFRVALQIAYGMHADDADPAPGNYLYRVIEFRRISLTSILGCIISDGPVWLVWFPGWEFNA
jgi:hypothetical protein